jgi:hypothetical protein
MTDAFDKWAKEHELNEKNLLEAARRLRLRNMAHRGGKLSRPKLRPHTYVFLQQDKADPSDVICLGIVFTTWSLKKFNAVNFHAELNGAPITSSGRLTKLSNDQDGIIVSERWCWESLLKEFKGLSAGNI